MSPRAPLMPLDEALAALLARAQPLPGTESVPTLQADGRVLAQDLVSALQVPAFDNSAMDGYALRCADVAAPGIALPVSQRIAAGSVGAPLQGGTAARIFTGAPVPPGADAVVMQEDCVAQDDGTVRVQTQPHSGQNIRRAGEDIALGSTVLHAGTRLAPAALGLAASIGLEHLPVARRPRVALLSTGDELVMPGQVPPEQLPPGAIFNSNRFFLRALVQRLGCELTDLGRVPDQREATLAALREAAAGHDVVLTSGGVSVGEEDHIKPAVESLGCLDLWQIAVKPGKLKAMPEGREKGRLQSLETAKASIRARVEHPFRVIKRQFGYAKVRFRGLAKNTSQVLTLFALSNLWMARKQLLSSAGKLRPKYA